MPMNTSHSRRIASQEEEASYGLAPTSRAASAGVAIGAVETAEHSAVATLDHMEVLSGRCGSCGRTPHAIVGV
jgi:hypothetical protein